MRVEVQDGPHAAWKVVGPLLENGPVQVGRLDFAKSKPSYVSREHLQFVLRDGTAFVKPTGANASFLLADGGPPKQLERGVETPLADNSLVALSKSLDHIAKCVVVAPPKAAPETIEVVDSDEDDVVEVVDERRGNEKRPRRQPSGPPPSGAEVIDLEAAVGAGVGVSGKPLLPGEQEARQQHVRRTWTLRPSRSTEDTPEELHYRCAESAYTRGGGDARLIESIEYHFHPTLESRWHAKKAEYDARFGVGNHTILFVFHGTRSHNVKPILDEGFKVSKVGSTTDMGYYGAGIYFSEQLGTSQGYNTGNNGMFLCKVLVGKPYLCPHKPGCGLQPGYTSHVADPSGSEVIMFDEAAMLPVYVVKAQQPIGHGVYSAAAAAAAAYQHSVAVAADKEPLKGLGGTGQMPAPPMPVPPMPAPHMLAPWHGAGPGHVLGGHGRGRGRGRGKMVARGPPAPAWAQKILGIAPAGRGRGSGGASSPIVAINDEDDDTDELQEALKRSKHDF